MALSISDLHWLAGLFEGEGSAGPAYGRNGYTGTFRMSIEMTDVDVIHRAARIMDTPVQGPHYPKAKRKDGSDKKPVWRIQVAGMQSAAWAMTLYILLGERRQTKLRELLSVWLASSSVQKKRRTFYASKVPSDRECRDSD